MDIISANTDTIVGCGLFISIRGMQLAGVLSFFLMALQMLFESDEEKSGTVHEGAAEEKNAVFKKMRRIKYGFTAAFLLALGYMIGLTGEPVNGRQSVDIFFCDLLGMTSAGKSAVFFLSLFAVALFYMVFMLLFSSLMAKHDMKCFRKAAERAKGRNA